MRHVSPPRRVATGRVRLETGLAELQREIGFARSHLLVLEGMAEKPPKPLGGESR